MHNIMTAILLFVANRLGRVKDGKVIPPQLDSRAMDRARRIIEED